MSYIIARIKVLSWKSSIFVHINLFAFMRCEVLQLTGPFLSSPLLSLSLTVLLSSGPVRLSTGLLKLSFLQFKRFMEFLWLFKFVYSLHTKRILDLIFLPRFFKSTTSRANAFSLNVSNSGCRRMAIHQSHLHKAIYLLFHLFYLNDLILFWGISRVCCLFRFVVFEFHHVFLNCGHIQMEYARALFFFFLKFRWSSKLTWSSFIHICPYHGCYKL